MINSTSTTTPAATTQSVTKSAATAILSSLDTGSGVDTDSLVRGLVEAQFAAKNAALAGRLETLGAQISGVSTLKSTITDFTKALENLVKGGTLSSQPISSNANVLSASALGGARLSGMTASITVTQLAAAQTAVSRVPAASAASVIGTGQLTLKLGTASYAADGSMASFAEGSAAAVTIDITDADSSLSGIAAAINAKKAGVTASVVTDADGSAYLSLKGGTGTAQAFTLEATTQTGGDLSQIAVGPGAAGMALTSQAKNAQLVVDGVAVERASNTISDLVSGVKLTLTGTSPTAVSLSASTPTGALTQAVNDFVETYNQVIAAVQELTDPIGGVLRSDPAAKNMLTAMKGLTLRALTGATDGSPATLAGIGVTTNRDGTLAVNTATLARTAAENPDALEAMFAVSSDSPTGLYAAMNSIQLNATSTLYGLGASNTKYVGTRSDVTEQQDKVSDQADAMTTRLTKQFASMNSAVASYKSTQAFLKQQIDAWTNSNA